MVMADVGLFADHGKNLPPRRGDAFDGSVHLAKARILRRRQLVSNTTWGYVGTARLNVDIIESYESPVVRPLAESA